MNTGLRILLVEDVEIAVMVTEALLRSINKDIIIDVAENGTDALTFTDQKKYSLIFMDIGLPDIDGLAVSEKIRQNANSINHTTPIIVLTGNDHEDYKIRAKEIGLEDFLIKPLEKGDAVRLLNDLA